MRSSHTQLKPTQPNHPTLDLHWGSWLSCALLLLSVQPAAGLAKKNLLPSNKTTLSEGSKHNLPSWGTRQPPLPRYAPVQFIAKPHTPRPKIPKRRPKLPFKRPLILTTSTPLAKKTGATTLQQKIYTTFRFGREHRLLLSTDKPLYKPGAIIWFQTIALKLKSNRSMESAETGLMFELLSPRARVLKRKWVRIHQGIGHGQFKLALNAPGGEYTIRVRHFFAKKWSSKKIIVRHYQAPRIKKKLEFLRKGYGPGDEVQARIVLQRAVGGPLSNHLLNVQIMLAGKLWKTWKAETGEEGTALIHFPLPKQLDTDDGLMNIVIRDGGNSESISRPLPLAVRKLQIKFFPEGGHSVVGLPSRVYFATRKNIDLKPIDLQGEIRDQHGKRHAKIRSFHDGMGRFTYTPKPHHTYTLHILKPQDIADTFKLPPPHAHGLSLHAIDDFHSQRKTISLVVHSSKKQQIHLTALQHEKLLFVSTYALKKGRNVLSFQPLHQWRGILRVTLFDRQIQPLAERLLFRHRGKGVKLDISPVRSRQNQHDNVYRPRQRVTLKIKASSPDGKPISQFRFGLSVVDDTLLSFADDHQPNVLSQRFLTQQLIGDIHKPNFYFDPEKERAPRALDLVMGIHGWLDFSWRHLRAPTPKKPALLTHHDPTTLKKNIAKQQLPLQKRLFTRLAQTQTRPPLQPSNKKVPRNEKINQGPQATNKTRKNLLPPQRPPRKIARRIIRKKHRHIPIKKSDSGDAIVVKQRIHFGRRHHPTKLEKHHSTRMYKSIPSSERHQSTRLSIMRRGSSEQLDEPRRGPPSYYRSSVRDWRWYGAKKRPFYFKNSRSFQQGIRRYKKIREAAIRQAWRNFWSRSNRFTKQNLGYYKVNIRQYQNYIQKAQERRRFIQTLTKYKTNEALLEYLQTNGHYRSLSGSSLYYLFIYAQRYKANPHNIRNKYRALPFLNHMQQRIRSAIRRETQNIKSYRRSISYFEKQYTRLSRLTEGTLYWAPSLATNHKGECQVSFNMEDEVTSYRIKIFGFGAGLLGTKEHVIESRKAFYATARIPLEVSMGDAIVIPVSLKNDGPVSLRIQLRAQIDKKYLHLLENPVPRPVQLEAYSGRTYFYPIRVKGTHGNANVSFFAISQAGTSRIQEQIRIRPRGFPRSVTWSGLLDAKAAQTTSFLLPDKNKRTRPLSALEVYPHPLANLLAGSESILREPHGCFEQTSSSNFPNTMLSQYLQTKKEKNHHLIGKALTFLAKGYDRLTGFETSTGGFSLFGRPPGRLAMTAYGLWQFSEMKKVLSGVDQQMINRNTRWVLSHLTSEGHFTPKGSYKLTEQRQHIQTAYISFALAQTGFKQLSAQLQVLTSREKNIEDPYTLSLILNTMLSIREISDKTVQQLIKKLEGLREPGGAFLGKNTSATYSRGKNLHIETTALAILALIKANRPAGSIIPSVQWLFSQRNSYGGFGTTQATVLALKALLSFNQFHNQKPGAGSLSFFLNGQLISTKTYTKTNVEPIHIPIPHTLLKKQNTLKLTLASKTKIPFLFRLNYSTYLPVTANKGPLSITTSLNKTNVRLGDTVRLHTTIKNNTNSEQPMSMARIRFPGALGFQTWQLKALKDKGIVDHYETGPREVTLYFLKVDPNALKHIDLDLVARITGNYNGIASSSYLYYTNEQKYWAPPLWMTVRP